MLWFVCALYIANKLTIVGEFKNYSNKLTVLSHFVKCKLEPRFCFLLLSASPCLISSPGVTFTL